MGDYENLKKEIDDMRDNNKKTDILDKFLSSEDAKTLPIELVKRLITTDQDTTNDNIEMLRKALGHTGTNNNSNNNGPNPFQQGPGYNLTKQGEMVTSFKKMTYAERIKISNNEPELYKQLSQL